MKTNASSTSKIALVTETISVFLLVITMIAPVTGVTQHRRLLDAESTSISGPHGKLLHRHGHANSETGVMLPERIFGDTCSKSDIVINQGPTTTLPSGIPVFRVEIMNICNSGCAISDIHIACGWFSSARIVNPHVFKRLAYNDCLVNDGQPLTKDRTLSFDYSNTFAYPLSVSSVVCP